MGQSIFVSRKDGKESVARFIHEGHVDVIRIPGKEDVVHEVHCPRGFLHRIGQQKDGGKKRQTRKNKFSNGFAIHEGDKEYHKKSRACR